MIYDDMIEPIASLVPGAAPTVDPLTPQTTGPTKTGGTSFPPVGDDQASIDPAVTVPADVDADVEPGFMEPYPETTTDPDMAEDHPAMRPRYHRDRKFNETTKAHWIKFIERSPYRFDAILYRAKSLQAIESPEGYETPEFGVIDINQADPEYHDPEPVAVLDSPSDSEVFAAMDSQGENAVDADSVLVLQIAAENVPVGSALEWVEDTADGKGRRVWWYVHRIFNLGTTASIPLYYCIPCRTFSRVSEEA